MNEQLQEGISQITTGLYKMAGFAVVLAIISLVVAHKFGGKTRRQKKAVAGLVWTLGFVLFVVLAMPHLFG